MRSRTTRALTGASLLILLTCLLCASPALALSDHVRDGVMAGVAMGFSPGQVTIQNPEQPGQPVTSDWKSGATPQYRLGFSLLKNRLVVQIANQQWLYEQGILAEDKLRVTVQNWNLGFNYYPGNPESIAGGIYFLASAGLANARLTLLEPIDDSPWGEKFEEIFKEDEGGWSYQVGVGFEFRLIDSCAAGVSVSYVYQSFEGKIFEDSWSIPMNLTLQWYW